MRKNILPEAKFSAVIDILAGNKTQSEAALVYNISNGYLSVLCARVLKSIQQIVGITDREFAERDETSSDQDDSFQKIEMKERQKIRNELQKLQQKINYLKSKA